MNKSTEYNNNEGLCLELVGAGGLWVKPSMQRELFRRALLELGIASADL